MIHQVGVVAFQRTENLPIGGLNEAVFVYRGIRRQTTDQTDVRTFRGLNRADTTVMRIVNVADVEAGTFTAQTAGTQGRNGAFVAQLGKRVCFFHELGELA